MLKFACHPTPFPDPGQDRAKEVERSGNAGFIDRPAEFPYTHFHIMPDGPLYWMPPQHDILILK
ncbi:MAG: hypothetical protein B5M55_03470 [Desulfococcus sp. 4484_242]|nr:MAG: hypothetical protein B5M55_03470 [Desulfococcus sp. 4484_242]